MIYICKACYDTYYTFETALSHQRKCRAQMGMYSDEKEIPADVIRQKNKASEV